MTKLACVTHGRDGYRLHVVEVPLWAYAVERAGEWVCHHTGNLLCASGLPNWVWHVGVGRRDEDGWPAKNAGSAVFAFGQWLHSFAGRREHTLYTTTLTVDEMVEFFPDQRIEFLEGER